VFSGRMEWLLVTDKSRIMLCHQQSVVGDDALIVPLDRHMRLKWADVGISPYKA